MLDKVFDFLADMIAPPAPSLESSAPGDALRAVCAIDLSELESVEPQRGSGRD
jgi:hypothetical protein